MNSFRQDLIAFLQSMDSNGCYSDEDCMAEAMDLLTIDDGVRIVSQWAMDEISADINTGDVPATAATFTELHDYVDANKYGGAFEFPGSLDEHSLAGDEAWLVDHCRFWSRVQHACDVWLRAGKPEPQHVARFLAGVLEFKDGLSYCNPEGQISYLCIDKQESQGYSLVLGNQNFLSESLAELEAKLLIFAIENGHVAC